MPRVLIIDDDEGLRCLLRAVLEERGILVEEADNGRVGLLHYRQQPSDLVFCDIFMEEQDGLATIRALRSEFPMVRIVAMSGGARILPDDYLFEAVLFGADAALSKPFDQAALCETVARLLVP